jgi:ubiquinone/menaquinone biosynthesis C-methylase UbiE
MTSTISSPAERFEILLRHLGLERVHLAACMSGDWGELAVTSGDRLCSLTVVAPHLNKGVPDRLQTFTVPSLVIAGDQGAPGKRARDLVGRFGCGELFELRNYATPAWADTIADRTADVADAVVDFFARAERLCGAPTTLAVGGEGEIAGIRYRIEGQGPALLLMPLSLAPTQWESLIPLLSRHYSVVVLGGAHLGIIALLEERARSGYGELVAQILDRAALAAGETILEVGCGSGAIVRALATRSGRANRIVATDLNPYILSEARALARADGLLDAIEFGQANAEALPYPDACFDVVFCTTVLEEGDADRMLSELTRVTRPGGRIAVLTRAIDVDWWTSLPVPAELKKTINALGPSTGSGVGDRGCADGSLYARLAKAGVTPLMIGPQFAIYRDGERLADVLDRLIGALPASDARLCRDAIEQPGIGGTLFVAEPYHCAVATKGHTGRTG